MLGIRAYSLAPGYFLSEMSPNDESSALWAARVHSHYKAIGDPQRLAEVVEHLVANTTLWPSGAVITAEGPYVLSFSATHVGVSACVCVCLSARCVYLCLRVRICVCRCVCMCECACLCCVPAVCVCAGGCVCVCVCIGGCVRSGGRLDYVHTSHRSKLDGLGVAGLQPPVGKALRVFLVTSTAQRSYRYASGFVLWVILRAAVVLVFVALFSFWLGAVALCPSCIQFIHSLGTPSTGASATNRCTTPRSAAASRSTCLPVRCATYRANQSR